ncbi:MAG: GGDEF domain-containing protein [Polyangiaceae bacterium]|nr:GGDEF domain-containing protein [Polyangiaceae bacterium]
MKLGKRTAIAMPSERPAGAGAPCLVQIAGDDLGTQSDLDKGEVDIGRDESCTITVNSDLVSRQHASVQKLGSAYIVADLGSTNGTFVNGDKITHKKLDDGDQIRVGKTVLKFMASGNLEAEYHQKIFTMVSVDALTGAYNKRYFDDNFGKAIARADATQTSLCLIIFDIDHFKKINDTHGHPAGDYVLKELVDVVKAVVRKQDTFCRVGGEEFTVLLPETDAKTAFTCAEFIRGAVEVTTFSFEGTVIPVTCSLGVALRAGAEPHDALYKRADQAMYKAKSSGRNQVC